MTYEEAMDRALAGSRVRKVIWAERTTSPIRRWWRYVAKAQQVLEERNEWNAEQRSRVTKNLLVEILFNLDGGYVLNEWEPDTEDRSDEWELMGDYPQTAEFYHQSWSPDTFERRGWMGNPQPPLDTGFNATIELMKSWNTAILRVSTRPHAYPDRIRAMFVAARRTAWSSIPEKSFSGVTLGDSGELILSRFEESDPNDRSTVIDSMPYIPTEEDLNATDWGIHEVRF